MVTGKKIEEHLSALGASRPENSRLVISLKKEDFLSCLYDTRSGNCISLMHLSNQEFLAFIQSFTKMGKDFHEVTVFLCHPEVSLVPSALFQESDSLDFIQMIHGGNPEHCISYRMDHLSSYLVFSIKEGLKEQLNSTFPQAEIHHIAELILHIEQSELQYDGAAHVRAHLEGETLFIFAYKGKSLQFLNSFKSQGPSDSLYYILHSMDSLGMDYQSTDLHLSGQANAYEETVKMVHSYCPMLKTITSSEEETVAELLSKHQLCAS